MANSSSSANISAPSESASADLESVCATDASGQFVRSLCSSLSWSQLAVLAVIGGCARLCKSNVFPPVAEFESVFSSSSALVDRFGETASAALLGVAVVTHLDLPSTGGQSTAIAVCTGALVCIFSSHLVLLWAGKGERPALTITAAGLWTRLAGALFLGMHVPIFMHTFHNGQMPHFVLGLALVVAYLANELYVRPQAALHIHQLLHRGASQTWIQRALPVPDAFKLPSNTELAEGIRHNPDHAAVYWQRGYLFVDLCVHVLYCMSMSTAFMLSDGWGWTALSVLAWLMLSVLPRTRYQLRDILTFGWASNGFVMLAYREVAMAEESQVYQAIRSSWDIVKALTPLQ